MHEISLALLNLYNDGVTQTALVRNGYDRIASVYLDNRERLKSGKYLRKLLKYLPKNSTILDLGCGAGIPVDDALLRAGHSVVGVDISPEQIKLARRNCPHGQYRVGDIGKLPMGEYQAQAVVMFYSLFHLPRVEHARILRVVASNLVGKGRLLLTMGDRPFEGEHKLYNVPMWSSQYGTVKNRQLVERAGLKILLDEVDTSGGERHQVIMAQKL